ncbi:hypothetical protein [Absidia glauca]|uniref:Uncharacterized protein n=1 Tax=Absidia glauca TaxID=4829 RepID=A0A163MRR1_ABSGL|nr:hypothetical protein [Absidia glauca]
MSHNPFLVSKVNTLQDAFPTIDPTILENTLWLEHGDMNKTFERLLAITDPSTAPDPPPRTTTQPSSTSGLPPIPPPRIRPPSISSQQRPLPTPPSSAPTRAKPNLQSVREELAQWRQELSNDRDMRRTSRRNPSRRHGSNSGLRPSTASNYEMQTNYTDLNSIRDAVNEGSAAALKAATTLYDRFLASNSVYGSSLSSSSSPSSSAYAYHQSNNTTPNLYSRSSSTTSRSSLATSTSRPSLATSTSRPLPRPPQQDHVPVPRNPFDSSEQADALPPPTYEAREHDTLIDPMDADHLLQHQTHSS